MTRDEFIDLLARLVADGELTEDDAADLLVQFDAGEITDVPSVLTVAEAIREPNENRQGAALGILIGILVAVTRRNQLRPLPPVASLRMVNAVQDAFNRRIEGLAASLANEGLPLAQWQRNMLDEVEQHVLQQMYLANGSEVLTAAQQARLRTIVQEQGAYLQRFADQAALRIGQGSPFTEGYIANRSRAYAGVGRGEFFQSSEEAGAARGDIGAGWVVDYISRDDRNTCTPCLDAERAGPYLPARGPMPGVVCLGRSYCRCRRMPRYDPTAYRNLTI